MEINANIEKVLFSPEEIRARIKELGESITSDYRGKKPIFIGILKGAVFFLADLARETDLPLKIDFISVSSYGMNSVSGDVNILRGAQTDLRGMDVIIVEDILDTGKTLSKLVSALAAQGAASVKTAVLLDKREARKVPFEADYVGFVSENAFLVGMGLDYAEEFRSLPYVGILKREYYEKDGIVIK